VPSQGQTATPAIVRKSSPNASPTLGAAAAPASTHPVRAIALRSGAAQLASSLRSRDMKKQRVGNAATPAHFSLRRGSNHLSLAASGLGKPDMLRASTAAPSLLSMDPARRATPMRLSAALPPFPCLDDCDEDDDAVPPPGAPCRAYSEQPAPLQYRAMRSLSRLSSVSSSAARGSMDDAGATVSGSSASNSTSLLLMLQGLPSLPSTPSPDHTDTLSSPNFYRSLSPPPELFTPCTPMASTGQDENSEQASEMQN